MLQFTQLFSTFSSHEYISMIIVAPYLHHFAEEGVSAHPKAQSYTRSVGSSILISFSSVPPLRDDNNDDDDDDDVARPPPTTQNRTGSEDMMSPDVLISAPCRIIREDVNKAPLSWPARSEWATSSWDSQYACSRLRDDHRPDEQPKVCNPLDRPRTATLRVVRRPRRRRRRMLGSAPDLWSCRAPRVVYYCERLTSWWRGDARDLWIRDTCVFRTRARLRQYTSVWQLRRVVCAGRGENGVR